jgi:hypothetical protein
MLKLERKFFEFDYDGKVYRLRSPSVSDANELQKRIAKEGESLELVIEFLEKLGLESSVSMGMEIEHLNLIVEAVIGAKKS